MTKIKTLLLFAFAALLAGCVGNNVKPMQQDALNDFTQNRVAVAYFYPSKQLNYSELVYKVLWNETRSNNASFAGIWDIDQDLTAQYERHFADLGLNTVSAQDLLSDTDYARLEEDVAAYQAAVNKALESSSDMPAISLSQQTLASLSTQDAPYLLVILQYPFHLQVYSLFNNMLINAGSDVKVVQTLDGSIVFDGDARIALGHSYEDNPREIEANNLAIFKQLVARGVDAQFDKDVLPKQMGLR